MDMKRKLLFFEVLSALLVTIRLIFPGHMTPMILGISFIILLILKVIFEGLRWAIILMTIGVGVALINSYISIIIGVFLVVFPIVFFPQYYYPPPSGPYKVGFRDIMLKD